MTLSDLPILVGPGRRGGTAAGLALVLAGCDTTPADLVELPEVEFPSVAEFTTDPVAEEEGVIRVTSVEDCDVSDRAGTQAGIELPGSVDLPTFADRATIFLNGFKAEYLDHANHVTEIASAINGVAVVGDTLTWQARGVLRDKDFKDPYRWCYVATVLAWNSEELDLLVDDDQAGHVNRAGSADQDTALVALRSYLANPAFQTPARVAILPRGYGYRYAAGDNELLQIAYNLDHAETYVDPAADYGDLPAPTSPSGAASAGAGAASWRTGAIFKDKARRRDYRFTSTHSALTGADLHLLKPPFAVLPDQGDPCEVGLGPGFQFDDFEITDLPFEHAVPVLSGFDLGYDCADHHVRQIAVWLHDVGYDKAPNEDTGTLTFEVISLLQDDVGNGHVARVNADVLGLGLTTRRPGRIDPEGPVIEEPVVR